MTSIVSLVTTGRDDNSVAEMKRRKILTKALQNKEKLLSVPFIQMIWFPSRPLESIIWPTSTRQELKEPIELDFEKQLNDSQARISLR